PHSPQSPRYLLPLHDALPISAIPDHARAQFGEPVGGVATRQQVERRLVGAARKCPKRRAASDGLVPALDVDRADRGGGDGLLRRSEEHTSELQSRENLVCRLL